MIASIPIAGIVLGILVVAVGTAAQAAIGMGLNLFAVALLALIDPVFVPGPVLVLAFLLSCATSYRLRSDIIARELGIAVVGLVIGTIIAAVTLANVSSQHLPRLFGALILVAVAITAAGVRLPLTTAGIVAASIVSGAMGTIAGAHGPPIALLYQSESPARIRSALLPFFVFANALGLIALTAIGMFGWREVAVSALLLPGLVLGLLASPWLIRLMSGPAIRASILAISAVSGLALAVRG